MTQIVPFLKSLINVLLFLALNEVLSLVSYHEFAMIYTVHNYGESYITVYYIKMVL